MANIVAITSCPTGIAHTFMAAEGLERGAEALGHTIKVETQGSVGAQNTLTDAEVRAADVVIIAADTAVEMSRFTGKAVYETSTNAAIKDGQAVVKEALAQAVARPSGQADLVGQVQAAKAAQAKARSGPYKHLLTGVSYMIPFVVAGGISIALAFAIGGFHINTYDTSNITVLTTGFLSNPLQSLGAALYVIGAKAGFLLYVPILAGFIAGYVVLWLNRSISARLPRTLAGIMPVLVLPVLGSIIVGLVMIYIVGVPVAFLNQALISGLKNLRGANAAVLGLIIGLMMAIDMGGPVNKAAYTFSVGLLL